MPHDRRPCPCGSTLPSWWEYDARNIPLARVCPTCVTRKLDGFREDVKTDPNYWVDEPIEDDC